MQDLVKLFTLILLLSYKGYLRLMSWERVAKSGRRVGRLMAYLNKNRFKVTYDNIRLAFPELGHEEIKNLSRKSFENLGITMAELLKCSSVTKEEILKRVEYSDPDMIARLHGRGKGLILLSGHYGNWEFLALTAGLIQNETVNVIVKYQNNRFVNEKLLAIRSKWGNRLIDMGQAARPILSIIRDKGIIALLADQRATPDKDLYVEFMGREAATYEAPASLSFKYDIPIVFGLAERNEEGKYKVVLEEIDRAGLENFDKPIEELTRRHVKALEDAIKNRPELWAWQHNRWKHPISKRAISTEQVLDNK